MLTMDEMKQRKKAMGLSCEQISDISGVPLGTVQKVFGGVTSQPRYKTLQALDKVFQDEVAEDAADAVNTGKETRLGIQERKGSHAAVADSHNQVAHVAETAAANKASRGYTDDSGEKERYRRRGQNASSNISSSLQASDSVSDVHADVMTDHAQERYPRQGSYTIEDYFALPDDQRVELIDGVFYDMAAPYPVHQDICFMLSYYIQNYIDANHGPCRIFMAPTDVQLDNDDRTMVQPDISIVCDPERFKGPRFFGPPDMVVEILSKSTRRKDISLKNWKYSNAGVKEYWMVDPARLTVTVMDYQHNYTVRHYTFHDKVPVGIYEGKLEIDFSLILERIQGMYGVGNDGE